MSTSCLVLYVTWTKVCYYRRVSIFRFSLCLICILVACSIGDFQGTKRILRIMARTKPKPVLGANIYIFAQCGCMLCCLISLFSKMNEMTKLIYHASIFVFICDVENYFLVDLANQMKYRMDT